MKTGFKIVFILYILLNAITCLYAGQKNVGQSGMTYLAISMCSRENAMGDAGTASVKGINGLWHNPSVIADIDNFAVSLNQVDWLIDTYVSGIAAAYGMGNWGTIALDVTYMDWGDIIGTKPVDRSVDPRGFQITGNIEVEDYALGVAYARRINDKFAMGVKIKRVHENLGNALYVTSEIGENEDGDIEYERSSKEWELDNWGFDFGTIYDTGWKGLLFAMTLQNFSRDMKYYYDEFQLPMTLKMGLAMKISEIFFPDSKQFYLNAAIDASTPNDYSERVNIGSELVYLDRFALRGGYKFNNDVESMTLGFGFNFDFSGVNASIDYAYSSATYFQDINRFSLNFNF